MKKLLLILLTLLMVLSLAGCKKSGSLEEDVEDEEEYTIEEVSNYSYSLKGTNLTLNFDGDYLVYTYGKNPVSRIEFIPNTDDYKEFSAIDFLSFEDGEDVNTVAEKIATEHLNKYIPLTYNGTDCNYTAFETEINGKHYYALTYIIALDKGYATLTNYYEAYYARWNFSDAVLYIPYFYYDRFPDNNDDDLYLIEESASDEIKTMFNYFELNCMEKRYAPMTFEGAYEHFSKSENCRDTEIAQINGFDLLRTREIGQWECYLESYVVMFYAIMGANDITDITALAIQNSIHDDWEYEAEEERIRQEEYARQQYEMMYGQRDRDIAEGKVYGELDPNKEPIEISFYGSNEYKLWTTNYRMLDQEEMNRMAAYYLYADFTSFDDFLKLIDSKDSGIGYDENGDPRFVAYMLDDGTNLNYVYFGYSDYGDDYKPFSKGGNYIHNESEIVTFNIDKKKDPVIGKIDKKVTPIWASITTYDNGKDKKIGGWTTNYAQIKEKDVQKVAYYISNDVDLPKKEAMEFFGAKKSMIIKEGYAEYLPISFNLDGRRYVFVYDLTNEYYQGGTYFRDGLIDYTFNPKEDPTLGEIDEDKTPLWFSAHPNFNVEWGFTTDYALIEPEEYKKLYEDFETSDNKNEVYQYIHDNYPDSIVKNNKGKEIGLQFVENVEDFPEYVFRTIIIKYKGEARMASGTSGQ